jgi:hypothetical protein
LRKIEVYNQLISLLLLSELKQNELRNEVLAYKQTLSKQIEAMVYYYYLIFFILQTEAQQ